MCTQLNYGINNSERRSLNPLNSTLLALLCTFWLNTALVRTRLSGNLFIYRRGLDFFTMSTESTNSWYFGVNILPKAWYIYNVTQFYVWNDSESEYNYDKIINQKKIVVRKFHHVKIISIIPVFLWSSLTFCLFLLSSNSNN